MSISMAEVDADIGFFCFVFFFASDNIQQDTKLQNLNAFILLNTKHYITLNCFCFFLMFA